MEFASFPREHTPELEHRIRVRAYELFEQRDGGIGNDLDDWLQAEKEVIEDSNSTFSATA